MNILISGATGFIGCTLFPLLQYSEHKVFAVVRKPDKRLNLTIPQYTLESLPTLHEPIDVFINLAGEGIADKPWSEKRKKELYESRVTFTKTVKARLKSPPKTIVSMSAIGYYGSEKNGVFDEFSQPQGGFAHELCEAWESAALEFTEMGTRAVIFRLGVVLGPNGGALNRMRRPYLFGLGGKIGHGSQWFSWVHRADVLNAIIQAISDERFNGVYNLTSPHCVKQKTFARLYAKSLKRPAFFIVPSFVLNTLLGEMASLLTKGSKVLPNRLVTQEFEFEHVDLAEALADIEQQHSK